MRKQFKIEKNIHLLDVKDNQGIAYFTSSMKFVDKENKNKLIQSIDKFVADFKEENKYKPDVIDKDPQIKSLRQLKYKLLNNHGTSLINGRRLKSPSKEIKKQYQSVERLLKGKKKKEEISEQINFLINTSLIKDELSFCMYDNKIL
jgi:hypothetical protein